MASAATAPAPGPAPAPAPAVAPAASAAPRPAGVVDDASPPPLAFWEVDGFRVVGKRISDTAVVMDELIRMATERVALEKKIVKMMQQFSQRWEERFARMPKWTLGDACKAVCSEATAMAAVHVEVEKSILETVLPEMNRFRAMHFAKSFGSVKVIKESMRGFERASKPYEKTVVESDKQRKVYYDKQAEVERLSGLLTEAQKIESAHSESECKKLTSKIQKTLVEAKKAETLYKKALEEGAVLQKTYEVEMRAHFQVCQDQHRPRLQFLKDSLDKYLHAVSLNTKPSFAASNQASTETVKRADPEAELKCFASDIGIHSSPPSREFSPWKPGQEPMPQAEGGKKLPGAWFVKAGETTFSLSHSRFFVLDGKDLKYYASCDHGIPSNPKGHIDLTQIKEVRSAGKEIQILQDGRVWKLFGKKEDETARWATLIASTCDLTVVDLRVLGVDHAAANAAADNALRNASATKIQAEYRGFRARKDFQKKKKAAITIQSAFRGHQARKEVKKQHQAATTIQAAYRGHKARKDLASSKAAEAQQTSSA